MPYIGYFQLIDSVDEFVIYDNIKYTKKGWINRNRILCNHKDALISLPLAKDHDSLDVVQRELASDFDKTQKQLQRKILECYRHAPYFDDTFAIIKRCFEYENNNLFEFIYFSVSELVNYFDIKTKIIVSSSLDINHGLKSQEKVLAICKNLSADRYINAIGGQLLYDKKDFAKENITLNFIKTKSITYKQFNNDFVPWLSIIDVMMFNHLDDIKKFIKEYELI